MMPLFPLLKLLLLLGIVGYIHGIPRGFVEEAISNIDAISGAFAPNPRRDGKPMLLLSSKEGKVYILEDPDNSDDYVIAADFEGRMCHNGERGLQSIRPHPNFESNRYVYLFYSRKRDGCDESSETGPRNRLSRFTMNDETLEIDLSTEAILLETPPPAKWMHNGGNIAFGNDGKLWVTTGDGGLREPEVSQDLGHLHGKILRLNDDGSIPNDNPYASEGINCGKNGGETRNGVCGEIYASGLRNPFRLSMDPNTKSKVKFHVGDVGASVWEEISVGGTDYAKANYGWPPMEGPCRRGENKDCPERSEYLDPFYYYEHSKGEEGGCVTGSVFVPDGLWPSDYKFLFIDFIFGRIYNLVKDDDRECRSCEPPIPGYRNETFYELDNMVDMFFGPYEDTSALYIVSRSVKETKVRRIRSTGSKNRSPVAKVTVSDKTIKLGWKVAFDGSGSYDPDENTLTYRWDFGDDSAVSTTQKTEHTYKKRGIFHVEFTVTDSKGLEDRTSVSVSVGELPSAEIISPPEGQNFAVGDVIRLSGSAVDRDGEALSSSQLFWEVRQHHASHFHPFLDFITGNDFDLSPAPDPEDFEAAENSYLKVIMYAVDKDGLTATVERDVMPIKVGVSVNTVPSGLTILVDEFPVVTPQTITTWANHELRLDVEDQPPFIFKSWSDGGARSHAMAIPASRSAVLSISATFVEAPSAPKLKEPVRKCSEDDPCERCEGHCENDDECKGLLVCFEKGGSDRPVRGCTGVDPSFTDWCTVPETSVTEPVTPSAPRLKEPVKDCSEDNPCERCEGHCENDDECEGSLVCFEKGGSDRPVRGCTGVDPSFTDWCTEPETSVTEPGTSSAPRLKEPVRDCSEVDPCERCEGHCENDAECQGSLVCFEKGGSDRPVRGCSGTDPSFTDWCTDPETSVTEPGTPSAPRLKEPVRNCSEDNPCERCEGHCKNDDECEGSLVCFEKGGSDKPVRGCTGVDPTFTDWCTEPETSVTEPVLPSAPRLKEPVRDCSEDNPCERCEGHCENDDECKGLLVCFEKGGRDRPVRGCTGVDPSFTDWCTDPETSVTEPGTSSTPRLKEPVRDCSEDDPCERCEGHCENDDECKGLLVCFEKGGSDRPVIGCIGVDPSFTDWCTEPETSVTEPVTPSAPRLKKTVRNRSLRSI